MMESNHTPTTRTLHRLALPRNVHDPGEEAVRQGVFVDCETTGADWAYDEVVEVALLPFTFTAGGRIAEVRHEEAQTHLRDPGRSLSAALAARSGLTDDDVRGKHIDVAAASALIGRSDLVVAHNARFDRPFVERVLAVAREKPWACSRLEIPWRACGTRSDALHCLLCHYGVFARDRHRALADCEAGVWLLAQALPGTERTALAALLERASAETVRLWAQRTPFEARGRLRARGYRWMPRHSHGIDRAWWTEVAPEMVGAERAWLKTEVYGARGVDLVLRRVTARERWRAEPAACAPAASHPHDTGRVRARW